MTTIDLRTLIPRVLSCALVAACTVGPGYERPPLDLPEELHDQVIPSEPATSIADQAWWQILRDDTLVALIDEALQSGQDLQLAAWRVEEARAEAGILSAQRWPQIQADAGASYGRQSQFVSPVTETTDFYVVNLGLSWEVDLWGRIRRLNEAALARFLASEEARRGVQLSLVSEVATGYFRLRSLDLQLEIAQQTASAFQETHDLFNRRLAAGLASALETVSAEAALATTIAQISELERRIVAQENLLSFLVGRNPGEIARGAALESQLLPPEVPAGLPADLLARRPDLRRIEQELIAANAEVGVAVADFLPRISLTAALGGVAPQVSELLGDGETWSVGGGLLSPLFQGRSLDNRRRAAIARWEQAKVSFEASVRNALTEVSTALVAYQKLAEVEHQQERAVVAYREAVDLATDRYLSGLADYFEVLQARQQLFPAESSLAETRFDRLATLMQLYRALGGGWQLADEEWTRAAL